MIGVLRGLALAAVAACLPLQASAATASDILAQVNQCGMRDPTGQSHLLSLSGDTILLKNQDQGRVKTTGAIPVAKAVFDFQPRSPNPEYGATLTVKCSDDSQCVEFRRDDGFSWQALGFAVLIETACGQALDLAGKSLPR
jgi:hypothetical protein